MIYAGVSSAIKQMTCSISQGSVLGLLLFLLHMADLTALAAKHGVTLCAFTDDNSSTSTANLTTWQIWQYQEMYRIGA